MSWVKYEADCDFPIENLPYGIFHRKSETADQARAGLAIGDYVLDLKVLWDHGFFNDSPNVRDDNIFGLPTLNKFMSHGRSSWVRVRKTLVRLLGKDCPDLRDDPELRQQALIPLSEITNLLPAVIGDYTDFYSSREHATNLGKMFRPDSAPLLPNWLWLPVGYHGRASSVVVSGTSIRRPNGQVKGPNDAIPSFKACGKMDFELEVAFFVGGPGNEMGEPIYVGDATDSIFGLVLMNDWSARDIQNWEYVPLGPFAGKNLGTTISPWIVTLEALEPFLVPAPPKDPPVLDYLKEQDGGKTYDIQLEVLLGTEKHPAPMRICRSNFKHLYWTMQQQLAHHTSTGCNMRPGDLCGSGTISGPDGMMGSLIEATWNGKNPLTLESGETRTFLEDGDTVYLRGFAQGNGYRIGFGECFGAVTPSHPLSE